MSLKGVATTITILIISLTTLTGCAPRTTENQPTQLEIREIQTREFDTPNTKLVLKSMMNVLQDEGFIIKNVVPEVGLLSAEKNVDVEDKTTVFLLRLLGDPNSRWNKHDLVEASANVSEFGSKTRVRINFQTKTLDNFGCPTVIKSINNAEYYTLFFEKVSKGIFIEENNI